MNRSVGPLVNDIPKLCDFFPQAETNVSPQADSLTILRLLHHKVPRLQTHHHGVEKRLGEISYDNLRTMLSEVTFWLGKRYKAYQQFIQV